MKKNLVLSSSIAAAALLLTILALPGVEAAPDAISSASIAVRVVKITENSALVQWYNDSYDTDKRTLCYDIAPKAPTANCTSKTVKKDTGSLPMSNLLPSTKYNVKITASDGNHDPYSTSSSFTTLQATVSLAAPKAQAHALVEPGRGGGGFDAQGRMTPQGSKAKFFGKKFIRN